MHSSEACVELQLKRKNRKSIQIVWPWPLTTDCFRYKKACNTEGMAFEHQDACSMLSQKLHIDCVVVNIFIFMMYENAIWKSIVPWHELLNASCTLIISTDCGNKWKYHCICHTKHYTVILCQKYASVCHCGITCWHRRQHKMKTLEQHPLSTVSNIIFMHLPLYKWGEIHFAIQLALKFASQSPLIDFA